MNLEIPREIIPLEDKLPIRIFLGRDTHESYIAPHFHEDIELIGLRKGTLRVTDNGEFFTLGPGDIHVFNSNNIHTTLSKDLTMEAVILQISQSFLRTILVDSDKYLFQKQLSVENPATAKLLTKLFALLDSTENQAEPFSYLASYTHLFESIELLYRYFSYETTQKERTISSKYYQRMRLLTDYIQEHYYETITLNDLAEMVHLNPSYLSRFFKKHSGMTFFEYVTSVRLDHAYQQLCQTDLPIMMIGDLSGFKTYHQFNKEFKKIYGMTPKEQRKKTN